MANLAAQHASLQGEIESNVLNVLRSGGYILGDVVSTFETTIAEISGASHAVGVGNGTDALLLALMAAGVGPGDEVVTCPFTFVATVETVVLLGAKPVFVDIDPISYTMAPDQLDAVITPNTKVILPIHLFGQISNMVEIGAIAKKHGLVIIGDAAQAIAATQHGEKLGNTADISTLSFYPTKNLGAAGDAGMVITNNSVLAEKIRILRFHGSKGTYDYREVGVCSRIDAIQAAVLSAKVKKLDAWTEKRREHADYYMSELSDIDSIRLPATIDGNYHTFHQFTISVMNGQRDALKQHLMEHGIMSGIFYPVALHLAPAYADIVSGHVGQFPFSEAACAEVLSIPVHPDLHDGDCAIVAETLRKFWS
jgi:dTDP-4-amino-4,6-dideoxygalactose transaminase